MFVPPAALVATEAGDDRVAEGARPGLRQLHSPTDAVGGTTSTPMMKCGHAANAKNGNGEPSCVICFGIHPGADVVDESPPSLVGRKAKCAMCQERRPSSP